MLSYIKGTIEKIGSNFIIVDNNNLGYKVYTSNPSTFKLNEKCKIFLHEYIKEDEYSLYGFMKNSEMDLFLELISVKGLGCRTALIMLSTATSEGIINAIDNEDVIYLKKIPKIGDKVARQIILDLKGKLTSLNEGLDIFEELTSTLKTLGYKSSEIKKILPSIDKDFKIEDQIKQALRLLFR